MMGCTRQWNCTCPNCTTTCPSCPTPTPTTPTTPSLVEAVRAYWWRMDTAARGEGV